MFRIMGEQNQSKEKSITLRYNGKKSDFEETENACLTLPISSVRIL